MDCCFLDLFGIPFKLHGRTKEEGFDCYGLVLEVAKRMGHKMVDLDRSYNANNIKDLDDNAYNIIKGSNLKKTQEYKYGNIIIFFDNKGRICHIGVLLDNRDFIHCDEEGVHITNLDHYLRAWEIYEWQE